MLVSWTFREAGMKLMHKVIPLVKDKLEMLSRRAINLVIIQESLNQPAKWRSLRNLDNALCVDERLYA